MTSQKNVIEGSSSFMSGNSSRWPPSFNGNGHSGSRDIMVIVCHLTLQHHVIKVLCDFMVGSLARYIIILPNLVAVGTVVLEI